MLAVNALFISLLAVVFVGAVAYWLIARPVLSKVDKACDEIDREHEMRAEHDRLEKEEEARYREQAEKELTDEFPRLHNGPQ